MAKTFSRLECPTGPTFLSDGSIADTLASLRVVFLTNFIPAYRLPVLRALSSRVGVLKTLVSTAMASNRSWTPDWRDLDVDVQRSISVRKVLQHPDGFEQETFIHLPYDSLPKLAKLRPDVVISGELGLRTMQAVLYRMTVPRSRLIIYADLSEQTERP